MIKFLLLIKRFNLKAIHSSKKFNKKFLKIYDVLKLNLGCGRDYKRGWINIDNNPNKSIKNLDINWDLSISIPFENNSVDFIFNEHFLEHLTVEEGQVFLKDCKRVLKDGGVLRISMPDLETTVKDYFNPNWKEDKKEYYKKFGLEFIKTKAEKININFRSWGHKWLYDKEELERRLKEAGFKNIKFCELKESDYPELRNLETRNESTLIAEVVK